VELFIPQSIGGAPFDDPCAGASPAYSADTCYRSSNLAAAGISALCDDISRNPLNAA